jgi:hypothetical protein
MGQLSFGSRAWSIILLCSDSNIALTSCECGDWAEGLVRYRRLTTVPVTGGTADVLRLRPAELMLG